MRRTSLLVVFSQLLALSLGACASGAPAAATPLAPMPTAAATAAPTTAPTPVPPAASPSEPPASPVPLSAPVEPDSCLSGEWEITDIAGYMVSVLPIELIVEDAGLEFVGTSGSLSYYFKPDSSMLMMADAYTLRWTVNVSGVPPMPMEVTLDGASDGHFSTLADSLTIDDGAPNDLSLTIVVAGQTVTGDTAKVGNWLPLGSTEEMTYSYTCEGDVLKIVPDVPNALPITLQRVQD